jgi:hypothetical protein
MRNRLHVPWRLLLASTLALLVTVATVTLLGALVVLPAVSNVDFLRADRAIPGVDEGALLIVDRIGGDGVEAGDVVVVAGRSSGEPVVYAVPAVADGFAVLSQSVDGSTLTLPQGDVRIRVTRSITGVGDAYEFVDSVRGWVTVLGSTVLAWIVTLSLVRWRRRPDRCSDSISAKTSLAPPPVAAVPVLQRPSLKQQHASGRASTKSALIAVGLDYAPQHDGVGGRIATSLPSTVQVSAFRAHDLAQFAPQRWLGEIRDRTDFRPPRETARWAGLGAVAAVVASATLLVAEENHRRQARRSHFRESTPARARFTRFL